MADKVHAVKERLIPTTSVIWSFPLKGFEKTLSRDSSTLQKGFEKTRLGYATLIRPDKAETGVRDCLIPSQV